MGRRSCILNIHAVLSTVDPNDQLHKNLSLALNSVDKRSKFASLHYHEVLKCLGDDKLELERHGLNFNYEGNIHSNRTHYEANIFAFVQNLHAVCDSFPYIVSLMLGPLHFRNNKGEVTKLRSRSGWTDDFLSAVIETYPFQNKLHHKLRCFMKDRDFLVLKGLVNQIKHQHLVRILNQFTHLSFEEIEYRDKPKGGKVSILKNAEVKHLMRKWNNKLFPKLFILFWTLHEARRAAQAELYPKNFPETLIHSIGN